MNLQIDLKELAKIKLKADLYKELYESERDKFTKKMTDSKENEIADPDGILKLNLVPSNKKEFSIEKTKKLLGDKAGACIKEVVDSKTFMSAVKNLQIPEKNYQQCYTVNTTHSVTWDGLDVYKAELEKKINA